MGHRVKGSRRALGRLDHPARARRDARHNRGRPGELPEAQIVRGAAPKHPRSGAMSASNPDADLGFSCLDDRVGPIAANLIGSVARTVPLIRGNNATGKRIYLNREEREKEEAITTGGLSAICG